MGYEKKLAVFIDILGTKKRNFDDLLKINKIFHKELTRIEEREMTCKKFAASFSDCAYIIYEINEHDENNDKDTSFFYYIFDSLTDLANTITTIQINGFLCRGGISYDDLYYQENSTIIFGHAINEACKLETEAIMPRIIIDDMLGRDIYIQEDNYNIEKFQRIIRRDTFDNRYYLNYLYIFSQLDYPNNDDGLFDDKIKFGDKYYNFDEYHKILVENSINEIKEKNDHNIIAKHKWQLKYLRQHYKERSRMND